MRVLIFGAGGVGLGFMGDLLGRVSAEIVLADVNSALVASLDQHGEYTFSKADLREVRPVTGGGGGRLPARHGQSGGFRGDAEGAAGK